MNVAATRPSLRAAAATTIGKVRIHNEDRYLADAAHGWFAVADGIGGLPFGERASECAIRSLVRELTASSLAAEAQTLAAVAAACHQAVRQLGAMLSPRLGIGTTLTFFRIGTDAIEFGHIGDCTAFLHRERIGSIIILTKDHSVAAPAVSFAGTGDAVFVPPPRLDRYVGQATPPLCDVHHVPVVAGDRIILCSDGVTRALDASEIAALSAAQPTADALAQALVHVADIRGGLDNATAVVVDFT